MSLRKSLRQFFYTHFKTIHIMPYDYLAMTWKGLMLFVFIINLIGFAFGVLYAR